MIFFISIFLSDLKALGTRNAEEGSQSAGPIVQTILLNSKSVSRIFPSLSCFSISAETL